MAEVRIGLQVDTEGGEARLKGFADTSKSAFNKIGRSGSGAFKKVGRGVKAVFKSLTSLKGLLISLGGLFILKKLSASFVEAASVTENYQVRLTAMLRSQAEGNRLFRKLADFAGKVPFRLQEIMDAGVQLSSVMKGGVDQITKWMPMVGDLAAVSGLTIRKTAEQVVRMYSAGAAAADLFRERGTTAMLGFKMGAITSVEDTRKGMMKAWLKADSQFRGATAKLAKNWTGIMSMLADAWFQFRTEVMFSGVFEFIKLGLTDVLKSVRTLNDEGTLDIWALSISDTAITAMQKLVKGIGAVLQVMRFFHNGWLGLKLVGNAALQALADSTRVLFELLRLVLKPLDIIFKGINFKNLLGQVEFNPFDKAQEVINTLQLSTRDVMKDTLNGIEKTNSKYDVTISKVKSWSDALEKVKVKALDIAATVAAEKARSQDPAVIAAEKAARQAAEKLAAKQAELDAIFEMEQAAAERSFVAGEQWDADNAAAAQKWADRKVVTEQNLQDKIKSMKTANVNAAINLLALLGQKNKAFAIAAIAFEKGVAIARVIINTRAAMAVARVIDPTGALSASVYLQGAISAAIIAATGIAQAASIGSGGSGSGVGGGGGVQPTTTPFAPAQDVQPTQTINVNINTLDGADLNWDRIAEDNIKPALEGLKDRDISLDIRVVPT